MATNTFRYSNSRIQATNLSFDTNTGSLGSMISITTSTNFSLVPPTSFSKYYHIYVVNTNSTINVTLPDVADVARGWRAKIILNSSANTGILNIFAAGSIFVGRISSQLASAACEVQFVNVSGSPYRITYYNGNTNSAIQRMILYSTTNSLSTPKIKPLSSMQFFSYSGNAGSTTINANTTTQQIIPWEVATPGRFVDSDFFNTTNINNLTPTYPSFNVKIVICLYINATGGATNINVARLSLNGTATSVLAQVSSGTLANVATQVLRITAYFNSTSPNFVRLQIGKTATSVGTNIVDRVNTYLFAEYLST